MRNSHLFRASLYAAICLATLCLWIGEESPAPYPWLVILCAIAAFAFTDTWEKLVIPAKLAPWLGVAVAGFFLREEMANYQSNWVLPLGHLFVLLQVILLFHKKSTRLYWYMTLMSFLQMAIAALHNNKMTFGILLGVYAALTLWTLTQFFLVREAERFCSASPGRKSGSPGKRSIARSVIWSAIILVFATALFLLIPRQGQTAWTQYQFKPGQYISGFDERIQLGQLGTILESDEEVMTVRMFDESGRSYRPREEPLWRGVTLAKYQRGRWDRSMEVDSLPSPWSASAPTRIIRQEITLQPIHRDVLFGLRPAFRAETRGGTPLALLPADGTLIRPDSVPLGPLQYTVESGADSSQRQPREYLASHPDLIRSLTQVPDDLRLPLRQYLDQLHVPQSQDRAVLFQFLLEHLRDPNQFEYSLRVGKNDPDIDPILDFLFNRRSGHCEYFASALALMLRAKGVPARVVNGFKGGDWNEILGNFIVVRQKHAHSWVEAVLDSPEPHWVTLDPTPGQSRQRIVAQVDKTPSLVRQVRDVTRQVWSNYVLNFNASEQEAVVYGPLRRLVTEQFQSLLEKAKAAFTGQPQAFNWPVAVAASCTVAALIFCFWLSMKLMRSRRILHGGNEPVGGGTLAWILRQLRALLARWLHAKAAPGQRIEFYERLVRILESDGFRKIPSWTPQQFAEQAGEELQRSPQSATVANIPTELVDRFYHVRFGNWTPSASETDDMERMLKTLSGALSRKE